VDNRHAIAKVGPQPGHGLLQRDHGLIGLLLLLDHRADPVGSALLLGKPKQPVQELLTTTLRQQPGANGLAARGPVIDHRDIEVGQKGHG